MKVLVTGANGFIGKRLVERLKKEGIDVATFTRQDGNISDSNSLTKYIDIDHVFHLAAKTFVPDSWDNAFEYYQTNVMGTVNVLEYCRKNKCSMTLLSTYVYGEPQYLPVDEAHPVVPVTPYHESKVLCENICKFYSEMHNVNVTIFRPFNVYGKGQSDAFLLPKIYNQIKDTEVADVTLMDLTPKRDYIYIDDVIEAMLLSMNSKRDFMIYNLGTGISTSVEDVIKLIMNVTGINKQYHASGNVRRTEISDCVADISRFKSDYPDYTVTGLKEGIEKWNTEK